MPFFDKGEPREALAVQDIVQRGEWLFPLKRATAIPSKPPLFHWSAALTSEMTGRFDEATIRFPSALYATLGVLVIYFLGRKLFDGETALLAGAILATTLVYTNQALNARVDMTLCFFVSLSLSLFYSIYKGYRAAPAWYYVFYSLLGIGVLAKGPLSLLLTVLVAGAFLAITKKWELIRKFCFHPGVLLTLLFGVGWYVIAVTRGGEGFVDRQLLQENLERFVGGSGHSHPFYYYLPYLFSQGLLWSLFLPFLLWDGFGKKFLSEDGSLFLKVWFVTMFIFFSISLGKRPVYLLPLYPALALLMAAWFYGQGAISGTRQVLYRLLAGIGGLMGLLLLVITLGALWNHAPGWFFDPIEALLKPKDRANVVVVRNALDDFGWPFTAVSLASSALWFSFAHCLWRGRMKPVSIRLVLISILVAFTGHAIVMPVIAETKSYRPFMTEVNERVQGDEKLYLYGRSFNADPVIFYRRDAIDLLEQPAEAVAGKIGRGRDYLIMAQRTWKKLRELNADLPAPLLESKGTGPEGDARLVLVRADLAS